MLENRDLDKQIKREEVLDSYIRMAVDQPAAFRRMEQSLITEAHKRTGADLHSGTLCGSCGGILPYRTLTVQMAEGQWWPPAESISWIPVGGPLIEWHLRCVARALYPGRTPFRRQYRPYDCLSCGIPINWGDTVVSATEGYRPLPEYMALEQRGHYLRYIVHKHCYHRMPFPGAI